jgi:hypothetical protein
VTAKLGRPSGEFPVFSTDASGGEQRESGLFKVTAVEAARERADGGANDRVGSGLIDVRSLVGDAEAAVVQPAGTIVTEVKSRALPPEDAQDVTSPPSRWMWWMMGGLVVAVLGLAVAALRTSL